MPNQKFHNSGGDEKDEAVVLGDGEQASAICWRGLEADTQHGEDEFWVWMEEVTFANIYTLQ